MTWKSTVLVTGATALVGWLASPRPQAPAAAAVAPRAQAARTAIESDIEQQAARLRARLRAESAFREPERDPFRFAARSALVQPRITEPRLEDRPDISVQQAPLVTLLGVAADVIDGVTQRTAILSAPGDVLLVREGDSIVGVYRVEKVDDETVDLIRVADGQLMRLRLASPK